MTLIKTRNNKEICLQKLVHNDLGKLDIYLQNLSPDTKRRFGPHPFDKNSVNTFYQNPLHIGYVAQDTVTLEIIAYAIIKLGYLDHDSFRLQSYGLNLDHKTDCTFAPSVADKWQSLSIGNNLLDYILSDLRAKEIKRIFLWGGVQTDNQKAVNYYLKKGFRILGQFEYNGWNYDMVLDIV